MKFRLGSGFITMFISIMLLAGCSGNDGPGVADEGTDGDSVRSSQESMPKETARSSDDEPSPEERYTVNEDGTVTDKTSGLTWMQCSLGQEWDGTTCIGDLETYTWDEAREIAPDYSFAGHSDWRLPTDTELETLVYCSDGEAQRREDGKLMGCEGDFDRPTIVQAIFPGTPQAWFWTDTTSPHEVDYAWSVHFGEAYILDNEKTYSYHVRLVR